MAASTMSSSQDAYTDLTFPDRNVYGTVGPTSCSSSEAKNTGQISHLLRLTALGLGLLCAILLTAAITLCVLYTRDRHLEELNAGNCTWTNENEQLEREYARISNYNDQLEREYIRLLNESDQLQLKYNRLATVINRREREHSILFQEKLEDHLRLTKEINQLQEENSIMLKDYNVLKRQCRPSCKDGWKPFSSKCYYFSVQQKSWDDSRIYCTDQGADLVIINSRDEQVFISQHATGGHYWIGLTDQSARTFTWVDGSPLQHTFWKGVSPAYRNAHCVLTGPGDEPWVKMPCSFFGMCICEGNAAII